MPLHSVLFELKCNGKMVASIRSIIIRFKLLLACFALITVAPSPAIASFGIAGHAAMVQGGLPELPTKASVGRTKQTLAANLIVFKKVRFAGFRSKPKPHSGKEYLFILHCALLR